MSNVIDIKKKPPAALRRQHDDQYVCSKCDTNLFYMNSLGLIHCVGCGALMKNLLVSPT